MTHFTPTEALGGMPLPEWVIEEAVRRALQEDIGTGDVTTAAVVAPESEATATIVAKAQGVIAGLPVARAAFRAVDPTLHWEAWVEEGARVLPRTPVAQIRGKARSILTAERVALNFLQQLSGVATMARAYVQAMEGTGARLLDTRKTVPGLRALQRYAVRVGGGTNHRFGLYDGILIKENHIAAAGGITAALRRAQAAVGPMVAIEIEVETLEQLDEAIQAGARVILLDNMAPDLLRQAVRRARAQAGGSPITLEASGAITLDQVRAVAETGVDYISSGALTHSARALDLSLRFDWKGAESDAPPQRHP